MASWTKPRAVKSSKKVAHSRQSYPLEYVPRNRLACGHDPARSNPESSLQRVQLSSSARRRIVLVAFLAVVAFGARGADGAPGARACAGNSCPSIAELGGYDPDQASKVYAADGRLITDLGLERRTVVPLGEMSPYVKAAFLATEDKRFYEHHGIDWFRVFGAIKTNLFKFRVAEGFSTITMQLARNLWPEDISGADKTPAPEAARGAASPWRSRSKYSKDKILELYLNQIDLGNRAYGVEAASQRYFGKSVRDLNVAEAATLAAIPKAPTRYNPRRNPEPDRPAPQHGAQPAAGQRAALAPRTPSAGRPIRCCSRRTPTSAASPSTSSSTSASSSRRGSARELYSGLPDLHHARPRHAAGRRARARGPARGHRERGRRQVRLTDLPAVPGRAGRLRPTTAAGSTTPYLQGLVVTLEAKTGYIRAMVGGRDFEDSKFNRATQALRQPGSTFKPIVYAAAVEAGYPLSHVMVDDPLTVEMSTDSRPGRPRTTTSSSTGR